MIRRVPEPTVYQPKKYKEAIKLLIDPERQQQSDVISNTVLNYANKGIRAAGENLINDSGAEDITFADKRRSASIGEPDPFYTSDFSLDENGWAALRGTVQGNVDGVSDGTTSYDNVLKFYASADDGTHHVDKNFSPEGSVGQYYRVTGRYYIPSSNTNLKKIRLIPLGNGVNGDITLDVIGAWTDFICEVQKNVEQANFSFNFYGTDAYSHTTFIGAGSSTDDIFYIKDIKIQRVGMTAHWVFDDIYNKEGSLLYRSNFVESNGEWNPYYGSISYGHSIAGVNNCLKFWANGDAPSYIHGYHGPFIAHDTLLTGLKYKITGNIYIPSSNTHLKKVSPSVNNPDDEYLIESLDQWIHFEYEVIAEQTRIRFRSYDETGNNRYAGSDSEDDDVFYLKDIRIYSLGGGYIGEDWHLGGAIYSDELISNGDFEQWNSSTDLVDWSENNISSGVREIIQESTIVHSGGYSVKMKATGNDGTGFYLYHSLSGISTGDMLRITFWTYNKENDGAIDVHIDESADRTYLLNGYSIIEDNWTEHTFYIRAEYNYNQIVFSVKNTTNAEVYVDGFTIKKISNGNHLIPSDGFDYVKQMSGKNPAFPKGRGTRFDGVNDYFYIPAANADTFNPKTNAFSFAFWLSDLSADGVDHTIFHRDGNSYPYYHFKYRSDGTFQASVKNVDGSAASYLPSSAVSGDVLVVYVYDTASEKIYINGVLDNTDNKALGSLDFSNGTTIRGVFIGAARFGDAYFKDKIAEGAYFNRALSEREIAALMFNHQWEVKLSGSGSPNNVKLYSVEGNGFRRRALRAELMNDISDQWTIQSKNFKLPIGKTILINFSYRSNSKLLIRNGWGPSIELDSNEGNAKRVQVLFSNNNSSNDYFRIGAESKTSGTYIELSDIEILDVHDAHGVMYGGLDQTGWGQHPAAIGLDGVNDFIDFGNILNIGTHDVLIPIWFKTSSSASYLPLIGKMETTSSNGFYFYLSNGELRLNVSDSTTSYNHVFGITDWRDGNWHYAVLVLRSGTWEVWCDNALLDTWVSPVSNFNSEDHSLVGKFWAGYYEGLIGLLPYHLFDGLNGAPSSCPSDYQDLMQQIYNDTQSKYE